MGFCKLQLIYLPMIASKSAAAHGYAIKFIGVTWVGVSDDYSDSDLHGAASR
jgi:hypothetical protein